MPGLQIGGLASGMDTNSVIAQLMQLESQPGVRWAQQKKVSEAREQALCYESADLLEGLASARERRAPRFTGR